VAIVQAPGLVLVLVLVLVLAVVTVVLKPYLAAPRCGTPKVCPPCMVTTLATRSAPAPAAQLHRVGRVDVDARRKCGSAHIVYVACVCVRGAVFRVPVTAAPCVASHRIQSNGRDLLFSATLKGEVDFEKAEHLDWPVRTRENLGSMGYGPRFRQDRGRGYSSRYLLDKPLDSVGPQVRSDWVSPGSIDFGTCTRCGGQAEGGVVRLLCCSPHSRATPPQSKQAKAVPG